jgi:secreted trypsin-like serine protease
VGCAVPAPRVVRATPAANNDAEDRPRFVADPGAHSTQSTIDNDSVVRIVGDVTCTGTLVAEDLVLTAHHCVSARDKDGRALSHDLEPTDLSIELGGDYLPWGEVRVRAIVSPDCGYASGLGDIALLVLSRRLIGVPVATPRLDEAPRRGERVDPVGFGRCSASRSLIQRVVRSGGAVDVVADAHFVATASICPGDSGGPAYGEAHDVVGVISASVMDGDDATAAPSVFTRLDAFRALFSAAKEVAAGASPSELPPYRSCSR